MAEVRGDPCQDDVVVPGGVEAIEGRIIDLVQIQEAAAAASSAVHGQNPRVLRVQAGPKYARA